MKFKDHFSGHAAEYAKFRPHYPDELFEYLASISPRRELAWDCATGNGQAAVGLARHFEKVIATDASAQQIESAEPDKRISYRVAPAEAVGIDSASVDLILVAQALHWFDLDRFFTEAKRVLKDDGALAISSYKVLEITPEIDVIIWKLSAEPAQYCNTAEVGSGLVVLVLIWMAKIWTLNGDFFMLSQRIF